ncbi:MAG: hypothetical protein NPIRA03_05220 [Nitrospirales bacterium]|nr:MAG: hypothetical protein NPIRA03_05220 [Nitrospirales bacterium]
MRPSRFASENEVGDLPFSIEDAMTVSRDSPPEGNSSSFSPAGEEETKGDRAHEPSSYTRSDFN